MNGLQHVYGWLDGLVDLGVVVAAWAAGWILIRVLQRPLRTWASRTRTQADDLVLDLLRRYVPWWTAAVALPITARIGPGTPVLLAWADRIAMVLGTLTVTLAVANFVTGLLARNVVDLGRPGSTSLIQKLLFSIIVGVGVVVLLRNLGIEITPVLAALGVGSLAVGLALQPTLTNVFGGIGITMAHRVRVGDYIRIDGGIEGEVRDIGWRLTEIQDPPGNTVLIPNAKLAEMVVINTTLPDDPCNWVVDAAVAYDSDLERVEQVALEEARVVQRDAPEGVRDFEPVLRYRAFGESAIQFMVVLRARAWRDRISLQHAFIKRLHRRFAAEGIEVPFPQRVVRHVQAGPGDATAGDA